MIDWYGVVVGATVNFESNNIAFISNVRGLSFVWSRRIILIRNVYLERFVDLPDVTLLAAPLIKSGKPLDFFERLRYVGRNDFVGDAKAPDTILSV
jgi:hypothetical protein